MEVLVGSTFGIEVSSPSATAAYLVANSSLEKNSSPCIFLKEDEIVSNGIAVGAPDDDSSDSSSSIGDDSDEEEGEEVESVILSETALNSLDSLEESLPIKRGLSNHFTGKSKSFANLSDVLMSSSSSVTVKDLQKPENPFNKRRRLLMANKWSRKSSFYSWSNPKSMPLLALNEEDEQKQQNREDDEDEVSQASPSSSSPEQELLSRIQPSFSKLQEMKFKKSFKSHSCFSLADLQHKKFQ